MRRHTQLAITLVGDTGFVRIWRVVHVKLYAACSSVHQIDAACVMDRRLRMDWHTQPTDSVVGDSANTASSASQYVQTSQTAVRTGPVLPVVFGGHLGRPGGQRVRIGSHTDRLGDSVLVVLLGVVCPCEDRLTQLRVDESGSADLVWLWGHCVRIGSHSDESGARNWRDRYPEERICEDSLTR